MSTSLPIWKGSAALTEPAESPKFGGDSSKFTCTKIFVGKYADALAAAPAIRQTVVGVPTFYGVESWIVERMSGGRGKLTINLQAVPLFVDWGEPEHPPEPVYEVDWTQIQKRLETHKFFKELSNDNRALVEDALSEKDQTKRDKLLLKLNDDPLGMALYEKKMKGEDSYLVFSPVVRATTKNVSGFVSGGAGHLDDPPSEANAPAGYQYLKTADRVVSVSLRKDKWEHHEEWTGAEEWDEDLYV